MIDEIKNWIWSNIGWRIREGYRVIRNLIRWFPVIWKDRDWDDSFIFTILQTKLKHQAKYIGDRDFHTRAQYDAQRMLTCVRLIDKIQNDTYSLECMDYINDDYEFIKEDDNELYRLKKTYKRDRLNDYFLKYPLDYKRVILKNEGWRDINVPDEFDRRRRIAMNMSDNRQIRAQKLLFKLLDTHIRGWWD